MRRNLRVLLSSVVLLWGAPWVPGQVLRIFVLTGQSNSLGTLGTTDTTMRHAGPGQHAAEQSLHVPFYWDNLADGTTAGDTGLGASGGWVNLGPQTGGYYAGNNDHWGPEIGFSRLLWDAGYRDFAVIKVARGGGGNSFWVKDSADDHMYDKIVATVAAATATLPAGYTSFEIAGLLYVQGESNDATEAAEADTRFSTLLANLQADLPAAAALKGFIGEIAGTGTNRDTTRTKQKALAEARADIGYASSAGCVLQNQDGLSLHYDADSQILLGERLGAAALAEGAMPAKPLPQWENVNSWYLADAGTVLDASLAVSRWADLSRGVGAGSAALLDFTNVSGGFSYPGRTMVLDGAGRMRRVLSFNGSTQHLWRPYTTGTTSELTDDRSIVVVCRVTDANDGFLYDGVTHTGRTRALVRAGQWQTGVCPSTTAGGTWTTAENTTTARTTGTWQRHVFTYDRYLASDSTYDTTCRHYINGTLAGTANDTAGDPLRGLILGSNGGSTWDALAVEVAELAVYQTALDAAAVTALDAALVARWGTISDPPPSVQAAVVTQTSKTVARFGLHDLLGLRIDVSGAAGTTMTLESVGFDFKDGAENQVARVALFAGGSNSDFGQAGNAAEIQGPGGANRSFSTPVTLVPGSNYLWIAVEPKRWAPLGTTIDARCGAISITGTGSMAPAPSDPAGALTLGLVPYFKEVRRNGQDGISVFRIPGLVCDPDGTLHAVYDNRYAGTGDLPANIDVAYRRSTDGGATWSTPRLVLDFDSTVSGSSGNGVGDPSILVDPANHNLWVAGLWSFGSHAYSGSQPGLDPSVSGQYVLAKSTDGGLTWSSPINVTAQVKDPAWYLIFQGPGHGIAMRDGTLVFPSQIKTGSSQIESGFIFSRDNGTSWQYGSRVAQTSPATNEVECAELDDGRMLFSMRTPSGGNGYRAWSFYTPGGADPLKNGLWSDHSGGTATPIFRPAATPDPVCQASLHHWKSRWNGQPQEWVVFGNPASTSSRVNYTLRLSVDGGLTWPVSRLLYGASSGYSCVGSMPDNSLVVFFEVDGITRLLFARLEEGWLLEAAGDTDSDGMPDSWEALNGLHVGLDDANSDPDHDGMTNAAEAVAGTNPQDAASRLAVLSQSSGAAGLHLVWSSVPGKCYRIEGSPDLVSWAPRDGVPDVTAAGASAAADLPAGPPDQPRMFYRVRILP